MSRYHLTEPPPSDCEEYNGLKFNRIPAAGKLGPCVKAWRGRSQKPYAYFSFKTPLKLEQWIDEQKKSRDNIINFKSNLKTEQAKLKAEMKEKIVVGTIFVNSWGYDQTNLDFYQVIEKRGLMVKIQEIQSSSSTVEGNCSMSDQGTALPDTMFGPKITKRITHRGLSAQFGCMQITDDKTPHYRSWYA